MTVALLLSSSALLMTICSPAWAWPLPLPLELEHTQQITIGPNSVSTRETVRMKLMQEQDSNSSFDVGDYVLTDREYDQVLKRLQKEAEAMNLTPPVDADSKQLALSGVAEKKHKPECEISHYSCPICLEELVDEDDLALKCGHLFHTECLKQWKAEKIGAKCPICSRTIQPEARFRKDQEE